MTKIIYRYISRKLPTLHPRLFGRLLFHDGQDPPVDGIVINRGGFMGHLETHLFMLPTLLLLPFRWPAHSDPDGHGKAFEDNELTVMKSAGLSLYQFSLPVFFLGSSLSVDWYIPLPFTGGHTGHKNLILEIARQKASAGIKEKSSRRLHGIVLYATISY